MDTKQQISTFFQKLPAIIQRKNSLFVIISIVYIFITIILKWKLDLKNDTFMYALGGIIGMYFMDLAEDFFNLRPSPFRSVVFNAGFVIVSFFIVSSSTSFLAMGLVLLLYLTLILWQIGELQILGNINSWFSMLSQPVGLTAQKFILGLFIAIYLLETWVFIF